MINNLIHLKMNIQHIFKRILFILLIYVFLNPVTDLLAGDVEPFLGRWALNLSNGAGWLEIRQEQGYLDADILWIGGSVVPVDHVYMNQDRLYITRNRQVVREKDQNGEPKKLSTITTILELYVKRDKLTGIVYIPSMTGQEVRTEEFIGEKIPPLTDPPDMSKIRYGDPINLFSGKNLEGWRLINSNTKNGWHVEDDILINDPIQKEGSHLNYGNLRTDKEFEDFNLKLEVNVPEGSNSGIYLRGIYEVQVSDSYNQPLDSHNMGAIYSRITPVVNAEKPAGEWQTFDITLYNRYVTVILNGEKIIDNQPLAGVTGGALNSDQFTPGPIFLQGDHGKVMYRNIVLTPIKD